MTQRAKAIQPGDFDVRVAKSTAAYLNGTDGMTAFGWVTNDLNKIARELGVPPAFPALRAAPDDRQTRLQTMLALAALEPPGRHSFDASKLGVVGQHLMISGIDKLMESMQLIHFWRVRERGRLTEFTIPRLDTVPRCCAYTVGLATLNRHDLRRGIKRCLLPSLTATSNEQRWHWFIDLPNSKARYCCVAHATAHRQRRFRSPRGAS